MRRIENKTYPLDKIAGDSESANHIRHNLALLARSLYLIHHPEKATEEEILRLGLTIKKPSSTTTIGKE